MSTTSDGFLSFWTSCEFSLDYINLNCCALSSKDGRSKDHNIYNQCILSIMFVTQNICALVYVLLANRYIRYGLDTAVTGPYRDRIVAVSWPYLMYHFAVFFSVSQCFQA